MRFLKGCYHDCHVHGTIIAVRVDAKERRSIIHKPKSKASRLRLASQPLEEAGCVSGKWIGVDSPGGFVSRGTSIS